MLNIGKVRKTCVNGRRERTMRFPGALLVIVCTGWPLLAIAQSSVDADKIADTMVRLCVGGGHTEMTSGTGAGGADVSLRSLDVKGNLKGEYAIKKSSAEGLVEGLNNALSQVSADEADKIRACLQPVRDRLLDLMTHDSSGEAAPHQTTYGPHSPAISGVHGNVTIQNGN